MSIHGRFWASTEDHPCDFQSLKAANRPPSETRAKRQCTSSEAGRRSRFRVDRLNQEDQPRPGCAVKPVSPANAARPADYKPRAVV